MSDNQKLNATHREWQQSGQTLNADLLSALVVVHDVLGIDLLLNSAAHQVTPCQEDALHLGLSQPLTGALESNTALVLLLGAPLPAHVTSM